MKILVTGGTGYIGSHTAVELIRAGHEVEILDNLYNSKESVLDKIEEISGLKPTFHHCDLLEFEKTRDIFKAGNFEVVIHFAGLKAVAESVAEPLKYYENNITGTVNLLKIMQEAGVSKIIFSSSATVYGDAGTRLSEEMTTGHGITNPYGQTKFMIEQILRDVCVANPAFSATVLRYFNPVGAHPSGLLGEDPNGIPNNLMPIVMKVAKGEIPELSVYGNDYPTEDGTCKRDYIHVVDLAKGHLAALNKMRAGFNPYNLGTGRATSVLEMVKAFEEASGKPLPHKIAPRRSGDLPELCAEPLKAEKELGWKAELTVADAMRDTLNFLQKDQGIVNFTTS